MEPGLCRACCHDLFKVGAEAVRRKGLRLKAEAVLGDRQTAVEPPRTGDASRAQRVVARLRPRKTAGQARHRVQTRRDDWCPERESNPYAPSQAAADFKSAVSTSFTTRAGGWSGNPGGAGRNRTGVDGFAGRCMTTLPPRPGRGTQDKCGPGKSRAGQGVRPAGNLERETSLELATSTLARLRSTN